MFLSIQHIRLRLTLCKSSVVPVFLNHLRRCWPGRQDDASFAKVMTHVTVATPDSI